MSKAYIINDNKSLDMNWDYNNRLYKVEDDEMTMTFIRTGSGQKLGKSVYVGPKPKVPTRPGLFRSPIRDTGGTFIPVDIVVKAGTTVSTDYFGAYEYENGKFARLNTATGYRDSVGTHVYVRDWQGNIRAVVRKGDDGSTVLEQATYYYPYGMPMAESTNPTANSYKYTGKELLTDKGFNCYDYGARFYDPATGIWLSADPKSTELTSFSHYNFCFANPVSFIDENGLRPSSYEASLMCGIAYHDEFYEDYLDELQDTGWRVSNYNPGIELSSSDENGNGLQSLLFERTVDGKTEYTYAIAGTNSIEDFKQDLLQLVGASPQYSQLVYNANKLSESFVSSELTFTGHSLGGGGAAAASMATNRVALTFNAAAVSIYTRIFNNLWNSGDITNFRSTGMTILGKEIGGDPISRLQESIGFRAVGTTEKVYIGIKNPLSSHSIGTLINNLRP